MTFIYLTGVTEESADIRYSRTDLIVGRVQMRNGKWFGSFELPHTHRPGAVHEADSFLAVYLELIGWMPTIVNGGWCDD